MNKFLLNIIFISFFLISCGSLPERRDSYFYDIAEANELIESGNLLLTKNQLTPALYNYLEAYKKFTLLDHKEGKFKSSLKITSVNIKLQDLTSALEWIQNAKLNFEGEINSSEEYLLLLAEYYLNSKSYGDILLITQKDKIDKFDFNTRIELTAYRIFSLTELSLDYSEELFFLLSSLKMLDGSRENNFVKNPLTLSFVYYVMGYVYARDSDWETAINYFNYSLKVDKSNSNYIGIADNLYAIGVAEKNLNQYESAKKSLTSAFEIYNFLDDGMNSEIAETMLLIVKYLNDNDKDGTEKRLIELLNKSSNEDVKNRIRGILQKD